MNKRKQLIDEGSMVYPYALVVIGTILCCLALLESYLQISNSNLTLLGIAHDYNFLTDYKESHEPNRGIWHPIAWIGSIGFIVMMLYSVRKRFAFMQDVGQLRYWLDTHMFIGIVATVFTTVHTTYKVGGIVSISFWSMMLVAISGILGRYIYIQIPRNLSGNELRIDQIEEIMFEINNEIEKFSESDSRIAHYFQSISGPDESKKISAFEFAVKMFFNDIGNFFRTIGIWYDIKKTSDLSPDLKKRLFRLVKEKGKLVRSSNFLETSQRLLHYWHVFHKPFAVIMFIIMFLHIAVFFLFRVNG